MSRTNGLIVPAAETARSGLGALASIVALLAVTIGVARYWADLSDAWAWLALGVGAFASGLALLRLVRGRLQDFGDVLGALGALVLGGAAVAGLFVPVAPQIGIGTYVLGWIVIGHFET